MRSVYDSWLFEGRHSTGFYYSNPERVCLYFGRFDVEDESVDAQADASMCALRVSMRLIKEHLV